MPHDTRNRTDSEVAVDTENGALRVSEERFRTAFRQAAVGMAIANIDGRIVEVNQKFSEILGYDGSELCDLTTADLTHPEDLAETLANVERLRSGAISSYTMEKRYRRKDGGVVWGLTTVSLLRATEGAPRQFIGVIEDITDRKRAEAELREAATRFQLALAAGDLGDWSWDSNTDLVTLGVRAADILGVRCGDACPWSELRSRILAEDRDQATAQISGAATDRAPRSVECRMTDPSGEGLFWVAARGQAVFDAQGSLKGAIGVIQEVTSQKTAEEARARLAAVVQTSSDAILSKTLEGVIVTWNAAAERMFGYTAKEVIGKPVTMLIPPDHIDEEPTILERLKRGERIDHYETVRMRKDGSLLEVSLSVSPIRDPSGRIIGASKIARDITRQKEVEAALRDTDRRKDEFLATLAHELRNPLAPIRQAALISQAEHATEAQKRWSHDVISRQVHHMALLLDDLLDISRITRGTLDLRKEGTNLSDVVEAAIETARPVIDAKRHNLVTDLGTEPVRLTADPLRLSQVLSNLLTNAAKYTDQGGEIRLSATVSGDWVSIRIADTGIGIAAHSLVDVFAMFSQLKSGPDRSEGGLGIGLALAKGIVELHGGTIRATSRGVGRGSEFTVRLPLHAAKPAKRNEISRPAGSPTVPRRVLIADDNRDAAETLVMLLRMEGHEVTMVHTGLEALDAFESFQPEVALLDIGMPGLDGYEVARRVRRGTLGRAVTLIAVTGWGQDSDKSQALAAGFNHHLTKPVEPARLSELIRSSGSPKSRLSD